MATPPATQAAVEWTKCPSCDAFIYHKRLKRTLGVCPECNFHFRLPVRQRLEQLLDADSWEELSGEIDGFTHRELALVSAIVLRAGDRHADLRSLTPAIDTIELELIDRAAIILALADAIETRCRRTGRIEVACKVGRHVTVSVPSLLSWLVKDLDKRFERAFSRPLIVRR